MNESPFATKTIAIVGVGLIGGSLALALKRVGIGCKIVGISREETLYEARELGVIDDGHPYEALARGMEDASLVFLCTPISRILALLPEVLAAVPDGAVVSDVGSTKREIVSLAESHQRKGVHFVGGHPMAGSEQRGVAAADPFLFENAIYVLTPAPETPETVSNGLVDLVRRIGARPMRLQPETHDRIAAAVSHLPQMMATALVGMVGRLNEADGLPLQMAAGGFRDLTRIASSPYEMWRDICRTNATPIRDMIDLYLEALHAIRDRIDRDELATDFDNANRVRSAIPKDSKGFLHPLHEILLFVEDRPGIIAEVASLLAGETINIQDIEVLKVREGEGGTIRLGFGARAAAIRALAILEAGEYKARIR